MQVLAAKQWLADSAAAGAGDARRACPAEPPGGHRAGGRGRRPAGGATGSGALEGYAAGPERVDEIVAAIAEAIGAAASVTASRRSAGPTPASRSARPATSSRRVGTPLDTVVVLAAALEQAGIRPLLWLGEGHAFLGYWREERSAEIAATTDAAPLVNLVDLGLIGLVETTLLTRRGEPDADLHRAAYAGWLTGELDRILGVTDVHRARRDGIVPLPARARDAGGVLQVVEYRPAEHSAPARPSRRRPRRRPGRRPRRGCSSGRTRCSTSACATG